MVLEARIRLRHRGCFTETVDGGAYVTQIVGDREHGTSVVHAPTSAELERILARMTESVERVDVVERTSDTIVVRCRCRQDGAIATIIAFGCSILWPAVYSKRTELYNVVAPSRERLDALVDRLRDLGDVSIERVAEVPAEALDVSVPLSDIATGLTERQVTVLTRAIEHGYYASPRRVSADDLARSFGVARSTFQEHLRKAESRILERFAQVVSAHPALLKGATRRAGRPPRTPHP